MARKIQVLVELTLEGEDRGNVRVTAPWEHSGAVVKMLGSALQIAGDTVAAQQKKAAEDLARAKEDRTESGLVVPKGIARA